MQRHFAKRLISGLGIASALCVLAAVSGGCSHEDILAMNQTKSGGLWGLRVTSTAFKDGEMIPKKYTADGENVSPPLKWNHGPDGVVQYVVVVEDPYKGGKVPEEHWIVFNIPASDHPELPENAAASMNLMQGTNNKGGIGYTGPNPPKGQMHTYYFQVFAVNSKLNAQSGATRAELGNALQGSVLSKGVLRGTYETDKSE